MKTVLLTGATGNLGRFVSERLSEDGFRVVEVRRQKATGKVEKNAPDVIEADLLAKGGVAEVLASLKLISTHLYAFVHLARDKANLAGPGASAKEWLKEYELSVVVPFHLSKMLSDEFDLQRVVLASSIYGIVAQQPRLYEDATSLNPHYGAAKAATIQIAKDLAVALAPRCQVNCVSWGGIDMGDEKNMITGYALENPSRRMITLEEAGGVINFLLSSKGSGITGHNLVVDGGWTAW